MFCPNLSDPEIKRKFESLKSVYPEGAYYLWDKYQGEVPAKYYNLPAHSSKSINNLTPEELQTVQNTLENKLIIEQDTDLAFKSGQAYHYLNSEDAARMSSLVEKHKEYPKEFKVTKKVTKYERKGLDFKSYNVYKDFIYVKTNNNKKSNLYNIIDKETGELVQEKVRVIHLSKDVKSKIADSYGLEHRPTKIFNANRSVAFALYRQKPSKAKYIAQAKKYLYDAIKFLNPNESNLTINLSQIEKMLDSFPEEMWDYINTTYSPEDSTNINASTSLQNNISIKLPKLGLIKEVEKITGLPILNQSFKNYDRSGKLKKVLRVEWGGPVTIDATLTKKQLHAAIGYYLKDKGYFKTTSEQENVRKYAEHNNINPEELAELVFGDFAKALDNVAWNMSGNSDSIEVSKWRESIRNYEWQSVELFAKPYEQFNANAKNRIIEKFKDRKLSNGISHLDYFFTGKFNWLNINFNNISGQYYLADNETLAPVGVSYKTAGIQNVFQMANYRKPKAGENFLKEEEVFNRLAAILHEPMHALHALSYGSKEELALRKSFEDLAKTEFGKQMLTQAFGDQYNNKSITPDILYKEFTAFATQLILYPKEWINQTNLRSNDILDFIEKIQNLQDKTYTETIKTIEKIGEQETTVTTEEKLKLDFLQKLYNYIVSALNRVIPISKQFFKLIPSTNLVTQKIVEDVFGEVERTQERTLELPKSIVRSKQEFLDAMDEFKNAIQGLMQTDASMFSSDNVRNFFERTESFAQESNSIKPRVSEVFKFNTELNKIGSEQQFSEYLDTLLPGGTIQYRGDQKGLSEFRYSTPTEESRRTGKVHKLGSGVYTTSNQSLAQEYAKSNNGEVYPVLVSKGLTYNTRMDFLQAVADSLSIESIPTESQVDKFVKDQQDLGNSITVKELGESVSSVKDSIPLNSPKVIEGFKNYVKSTVSIKEGVSELFESNSELANAVYKALGFNNLINPTDRIIWGHPTIGKTTAKQEKNFLDFDTDFKPLVAEKLGLPKSKQNSVDLNKWRETGSEEDFNRAMQEVWSLAKEQAKSQNKILMVSDMLFLRENASDFDKVINIPSDVFLDRAAQRKDSVENLQSWKGNIDKTLGKIDSKKIITTDKYLSDLFLSPEQKQQAQQLYSQYLDSIFPDSKVKDIVYHRSPNKFDKFDKKFKGVTSKLKDAIDGFFFSSRDIGEDIKYSMNIDLGSNVYNAILNIKNPIETDTWSDTPDTKGSDGISRLYDDFTEYVAFESEQIHILGNKQDIEGFKQFVSKPSENVMYSRSGNREAIINSLLTEDKFKDLLLKTFNLQLTGNPVTNRQLVRNYVWENVKSNLNYNGQFSINGDTISILPSTNVTFDQSKGIAAAYTNQLNKAHFSNVLGDSFKYKLVEGVPSIVYEPSSSLLNLVASAVSIDQQREAELVAQLEAEVALISIAENAKAEQIGLLEKLASANEAVIDGEIYPLDNSVFDSRISLMRWTSRSTTQKFGKLLDKLSERFPGVTWEWDTSIDNPGKVDLNSGKILVNPSLINEDTPWHEFGHIVVRMIKQSNPELFNSLKKDVQRLHELAPQISSQSYVEELYPEYIGTDLLWEEAIVTELGRQSVDVYEKAAEYKNSESLFQKIKNWINTLINDMLGKTADLTNITTISELADILAGTEVKFEQFKNKESENAVSEFMFSRVLNESQRDLLISQIKTPEGTTDYTEWGAKLKDLTSKIDIEEFRKLIYTNKFLGVDNIALETARRALTRIADIITAEDVAEAMLDLSEFYQYGAFYLSRLEANMKLIEEENKLPIAKQLSIFHNSYKQALAFESYFKELQKLFKVGTSLPTSTEEKQTTKQIGFLANTFSINTSIRQIKEAHSNRIEKPVAKILAENFKQSTKKLTEDFNKEIARLTKLNTSGKLTKKIKNLEKQRDELTATEENIIKFFKQEVNNTWLPQGLQWADTNTTSSDPAVNIVANYINDMINEARAELIPVANLWQNLMSEISELQGNFTGTFIDVKEFYKPYYRVTEEYEVVNGELVKGKKVLVLNTPAKIQELQNKFTELNYIISTSEDELKRNEAEDELKRLYEEYTERPFTDEYYELQKLLPEKVRAIRQEKFDLISALHETLLMEDDANSEQTVYRLKLANKELYDLERLYDDLGNLKTGEDREIAEAIIQWKESRREAASIVYEISEESKGTYERELAKRKLIRDTNIANALTQEDKDLAIKAYNNWTSVYSRTVYSEEFYLERESILGEIHKLLGKSTDTKVDTLYKEIFNALRGRKDKNNQYDARDVSPELARTLRIKEEAIEEAKKSIKKSPLSAEDRQKFFSLLQQLEDLQTSVPTEHYKDTVDSIKESLRSQVINEKPGLDILSVEKEVESRFRNSQWYKDNHISKVRWNKDTEEMQTVMEPLFMWRVTAPKNPKYILREQPSFYWFKAKVNPQFKNPKYRPGEVTFKEITAGTYYNSGYDQLSPSQKALLGKIRDAHYATQEGIYSRDKLYDKIPGLEKSLGEISLDTVKLKNNPLKEFFAKTKNIVTFNTENDPNELSEGIADQSDVFGNTLNKSARRIFLRYSRALPLEEQSYDIMAAMASYAAAAVRFKTIRKYQSSLLSTEETLNTLAGSESTRAKLIQNMMDRVVYGRSRRKVESGAGKLLTSITSGVSKLAGSAALGLNIKAIPKNWFNGYFTSWTQMQQNGLTKDDFAKAHIDTFGLSKEYFTEFAQFGKSSLKLQLVDYFAGLQHNPFRDAKDVSNVGLRKYGKFWKIISTLRAYSEFDIAANIVFAFLNKHRVKIKGSTQTIPLKEAFVSKDGVITLRDDVDVTEDFIAHIRREIQLANTRSQGAYDEMAQPEAIKFAAVRMTLWMKRFVVQHLKTTYGGETIHYGSGIRTVGGHRALLNVMRDFFSTGTFVGMSAHDKSGLLQLAKSYSGYIILANMIKAMSLIGNCEDDGVADWKDTVCFYLKSINSEVEGVFTVWGMNEFLNTYYQERASNISAIEKFGSSLWGPYSTVSKWFDSDLWTTDPYYKYKPNSTKIDWDRTHPLFAGKPGLWVLAQKVLGSTGLAIDPTSTEYDNRRFNAYTPKTYTKQLSTEFKENYEGVKERPSRTPIGQIKKQYKKEVLEIKKEIIQARKKGEDDSYLFEKLKKAQENAIKATQNLSKSKLNEYSIDVLPMPFWKRKGMDLEEMSEDSLD